MKTIESTATRKIKTTEVKYSNMTFVVTAETNYINHYAIPGWVRTCFTAKIKETGECTGLMGSKEEIRNHLSLINSRPDLFLSAQF